MRDTNHDAKLVLTREAKIMCEGVRDTSRSTSVTTAKKNMFGSIVHFIRIIGYNDIRLAF